MSPRTAKRIISSLLKKGFVEKDTHHIIFRLYVDGEKTDVCTYLSHGAQECGDSLLGKMAKQLRLTRTQFDAFIDCTLSMEAYIEILRELGAIKD